MPIIKAKNHSDILLQTYSKYQKNTGEGTLRYFYFRGECYLISKNRRFCYGIYQS